MKDILDNLCYYKVTTNRNVYKLWSNQFFMTNDNTNQLENKTGFIWNDNILSDNANCTQVLEDYLDKRINHTINNAKSREDIESVASMIQYAMDEGLYNVNLIEHQYNAMLKAKKLDVICDRR